MIGGNPWTVTESWNWFKTVRAWHVLKMVAEERDVENCEEPWPERTCFESNRVV